jgi:hypothetical protein
LRHVIRRASPVVARRVSARIAVTDRGGQRAREQGKGRTSTVASRRREPAVEPRGLPSAADDVDHDACDDDDGRAVHDDDDRTATAADNHDDDATAAAHDNHDHRTAASRDDEQRGR